MDRNPSNQLPVIIDSKKRRVPGTSSTLIEYLDGCYGAESGVTLVPTDPYEAACVRELITKFDSRCVGPLYQFLRCKAEKDDSKWRMCRDLVQQRLDEIEQMLASHDCQGPYRLGSTFSSADICIGSVLHLFAVILPLFREYTDLLSPSRVPGLARAMHALKQRPAFCATAPTSSALENHYQSDAVYHPNGESKHLDDWVQKMLNSDQRAP